eukprot:1630625-Prymnesium_polylepis.1
MPHPGGSGRSSSACTATRSRKDMRYKLGLALSNAGVRAPARPASRCLLALPPVQTRAESPVRSLIWQLRHTEYGRQMLTSANFGAPAARPDAIESTIKFG